MLSHILPWEHIKYRFSYLLSHIHILLFCAIQFSVIKPSLILYSRFGSKTDAPSSDDPVKVRAAISTMPNSPSAATKSSQKNLSAPSRMDPTIPIKTHSTPYGSTLEPSTVPLILELPSLTTHYTDRWTRTLAAFPTNTLTRRVRDNNLTLYRNRTTRRTEGRTMNISQTTILARPVPVLTLYLPSPSLNKTIRVTWTFPPFNGADPGTWPPTCNPAALRAGRLVVTVNMNPRLPVGQRSVGCALNS